MNTLLISVQRDLDTLGLNYLHSYLGRKGYNSHLLYLPYSSPQGKKGAASVQRFVAELNPKLIGVSLMSLEFRRATELTRCLKANFPSVPVVWGGIHPTVNPEECLEHADYVCVGEGEEALAELAQAIREGIDPQGIPNVGYREKEKTHVTPPRPPIADLDRLPYHERIPSKSYILHGSRIHVLDQALFRKYARYSGMTYSTITSRGCPYACTYCCNNILSRRYASNRVRRRSVAHVIEELACVRRDHPDVKYINFQDDCFLACTDQYLQEFCQEYKRRVGVSFIVRSTPLSLSPERIRWLKKAGLAWISLGLQSGSDRVNKDIYNRKSTQADFLKASRWIRDANVAAFYDVILDNPLETEEDKLETVLTLARTPKPFHTQLFSLTLYHGTELHERIAKECPNQVEDYRIKDNHTCDRNPINDLTRLASFLDRKTTERLVSLYRQGPRKVSFRAALFAAKLVCATLIEPITLLRMIVRAESGSLISALATVPAYAQEGIRRYLGLFRTRKLQM